MIKRLTLLSLLFGLTTAVGGDMEKHRALEPFPSPDPGMERLVAIDCHS